jgi:hypothetical protein
MINTNNNSNMQHNQNKFSLFEEDNEDDLVEIRPIRRRDAVEKGLDYWIDDSDWLKEKQRRSAFKNRKVCIRIMCCLYVLGRVDSSLLIKYIGSFFATPL